MEQKGGVGGGTRKEGGPTTLWIDRQNLRTSGRIVEDRLVGNEGNYKRANRKKDARKHHTPIEAGRQIPKGKLKKKNSA